VRRDQKVSRFQFPQQAKFALVAFTNVCTNLPNEHIQQLAYGTWVCQKLPISIEAHWKEWLGTLRLEELERSNLFIIKSAESVNPHVLDDEHTALEKQVSQTFEALHVLGCLEYERANLLCGSFSEDQSKIRRMSRLLRFYQTRGYTREPLTIDHVIKAMKLQSALDEIETVSGHFKRFRRGWYVLIDGLRQRQDEARIHQFVRAVEALIMPEIGRTKRQFVHRCQTFLKVSQHTRQTLEEAFDLRSMAEHLNDWEQALQSYQQADREIIAWHRTRQIEKLAKFAYTCIMEDATLREHFSTETKQQAFWNLPDGERKNLCGKELDLSLIREVRAFDSWGRAPLY
jgi:hypothetical protein